MKKHYFVIAFATGSVIALSLLSLIMWPVGAAGYGFSAGLHYCFTHTLTLLFFMLIGLCTMIAKNEAYLVIPFCMIGIWLLSAFTHPMALVSGDYRSLIFFITLIYALLMSLVFRKGLLIGVALLSSIVFLLARTLGDVVPNLAAYDYFVLGTTIALAIVTIAGMAIGLLILPLVKPLMLLLLRKSIVRSYVSKLNNMLNRRIALIS